MKIHQLGGINYDSNIFLVEAPTPILIDAGTGMYGEKVIADIDAIVALDSIEAIILTHNHPDHSFGVNRLQAATGARIYAHRIDAKELKHAQSSVDNLFGLRQENVNFDRELEDGDRVDFGEGTLKVIHTPGHTPGGIALYDEKNKNLFSGDTIFANGDFGRCDLPGGNARQLLASIEKLAALDVRNLYPGHGPSVEGDAAKHIQLSLKYAREMFS